MNENILTETTDVVMDAADAVEVIDMPAQVKPNAASGVLLGFAIAGAAETLGLAGFGIYKLVKHIKAKKASKATEAEVVEVEEVPVQE